ncbi:MAG: PKD domain-containing protein, partial [Candidatus Kariarchaeaceae archaeon]
GHELWIEEGKLFPDFVSASNTDDRDGDLYLPLNTNTTIEYRVRNNENNTAEYLSFVTAENETALYNSSMSSVVNMTRTNYTTIGEANFSIFQLELNMTSPILYFTAFNDRGWERSDGTTPVFHRLFNGFSFNLTYSESVSLYTNLDAISWNITTFNQTDDMSVGYQYRYFENDTAEEALLNWTTIDNLVNSTNDVHVNSSADGTLQINSTRLSTYNVTLSESFNVSNLVEVRSFVKYGSGSNITTDVQQIIVIDPNPIIAISNKNGTYTRAVNATILFDISTPKGELVTVTMEQFLPDNSSKTVFDLVDKQNQTILFAFSDTNDTILDGNHTVVINATNSIGQSTVVSFTLIVDRTNPTGTLSSASETTVSSGRVTVDLSGQDVGDGSGIQIMTLDWGDNVTINVTSLSSASHTYRTSGTYSITLTVYDNVGNEFFTTIEVQVVVETTTTTETNDSPFPVLSLFIGSMFLAVYRRSISKKGQ